MQTARTHGENKRINRKALCNALVVLLTSKHCKYTFDVLAGGGVAYQGNYRYVAMCCAEQATQTASPIIYSLTNKYGKVQLNTGIAYGFLT